MKTTNIYFFLYVWIFSALLLNNLNAQTTAIPDPAFEQALIDLGIDSDGTLNGQVFTGDIDTVTVLYIPGKNINYLSGIEDFSNLEKLIVRNNNLSTLDLSANTQLKILNCRSNPLTSLNLANNILLDSLTTDDKPDNIDLSNNVNLKYLECSINSLDISNNINLEYLNISGICPSNFSFDISNNLNLKTLIVGSTCLAQIDLSNNTQLEYLDLSLTPLTSLDLSNNIQLKELYLNSPDDVLTLQITSLDLSNNVNLELLHSENMFTLENLNLKNGNNTILTVEISAMAYPGGAVDLPYLHCVQVDDETAADNNQPPYSSWYISADFEYSEDCSTSISGENLLQISIYPNPSSSGVFKIKNPDNKTSQVQVSDVSGKIVFDKLVTDGIINLSRQNKGIYFVKITDNKAVFAAKILID